MAVGTPVERQPWCNVIPAEPARPSPTLAPVDGVRAGQFRRGGPRAPTVPPRPTGWVRGRR
ncbi:hypothetical protein GCM10027259_59270 [Micromonospora palomenae]